jgi:hypothetical protein
MSNQRHRQPRTSALSGRHPAVPLPATGQPPTAPMPATPVTPTTVTKPAIPAKPPGSTQKMTVNISRDLIDEAKDAFWLAHGEYRTFSAWVEHALRRHIDATKTAHGVDQLPRRPGSGSLPSGRPLG